MLYNNISELTREDMDIDRAKIEIVKPELWAKTDKNDTDVKSSGLNVSYLPQDGNNVQWLMDGRDAMVEMYDVFIICNYSIFLKKLIQ